jgi:transcription-repair coupling factor (superfamily II helicase)
VEHLLKIVAIKALCRRTNVEKIEAGPKGVVISFRDGRFENPAALVKYIGEQGVLAKIRPDQKIVLIRDWPDPEQRLKGTAAVLVRLARMVDEAAAGGGGQLRLEPTPEPAKAEPVKRSAYPSVSSFKAKGSKGGKGGSRFDWRR